MILIDAHYTCAVCGSPNPISVDPSGGLEQEYLEDCLNCCRPNRLWITLDPEAQRASVVSEMEYE